MYVIFTFTFQWKKSPWFVILIWDFYYYELVNPLQMQFLSRTCSLTPSISLFFSGSMFIPTLIYHFTEKSRVVCCRHHHRMKSHCRTERLLSFPVTWLYDHCHVITMSRDYHVTWSLTRWLLGKLAAIADEYTPKTHHFLGKVVSIALRCRLRFSLMRFWLKTKASKQCFLHFVQQL